MSNRCRFPFSYAVFLAVCLGCSLIAKAAVHTPSANLDLGENQLNQLLQDRPQLESIVIKDNAIWKWLRAAFGDTSRGFQIQWDSKMTADYDPADAESTAYPDTRGVSYVRVNGIYKNGPKHGLERPSEEVLNGIVFELNNVRHSVEKRKLQVRVELGTIERQEFIRSAAQIEFQAVRETADFYYGVWAPFCQQKGIQPTPRLWDIPLSATFDQWLLKFPPDHGYPWKYFGDYYDWYAAQREGYEKFRNGDVDGAVADYTKALNLGTVSYFERGMVEMVKGEWDQSLADLRQAGAMDNGYTGIYGALLCWVIQVQKGRKLDADHDLSSYLSSRPVAAQNDWPSRIGGFLLNQMSETDLMTAAVSVDPSQDQKQHCEAWYYIGMKHLLAGEKDAAALAFNKCLTTQANVPSYVLAREQLKSLQKSADGHN